MRQFGELESAVMDRLWLWDRPASVREVLEDMQRDRRIAYTTVMTVMDNLHRKGLLERELDGRAYLYRPALPRVEYSAQLMADVLDGSKDRTGTLMRLVEKMTPGEVARLRRLLNKAGRGSSGR